MYIKNTTIPSKLISDIKVKIGPSDQRGEGQMIEFEAKIPK